VPFRVAWVRQAHDHKTCFVLDRQGRDRLSRTANRYDASIVRIGQARGQSREQSLSRCNAVTFEIDY
jgi:hypothetical protein